MVQRGAQHDAAKQVAPAATADLTPAQPAPLSGRLAARACPRLVDHEFGLESLFLAPWAFTSTGTGGLVLYQRRGKTTLHLTQVRRDVVRIISIEGALFSRAR